MKLDEKKEIRSVARRYNIDARAFGDYIEASKDELGRRNDENFSYAELQQLAQSYREDNMGFASTAAHDRNRNHVISEREGCTA